jgi:methylthioribose-1-phosphate isomerase
MLNTMTPHPNHPPRPRDTRSLLGSLAVAVVMLAVLLMATSCAPIPRAIIPPASEIAKLDVAPVQAAGKVTREAVREVAKAGESTRETAVHLRASIDRAEKIAEAHEELREAFKEIQTFAKRLSADLKLAEEKERIALATIDSLEDEIAALKANAWGYLDVWTAFYDDGRALDVLIPDGVHGSSTASTEIFAPVLTKTFDSE